MRVSGQGEAMTLVPLCPRCSNPVPGLHADHVCSLTAVQEVRSALAVVKYVECAGGCGSKQHRRGAGGRTVSAFVCGDCHVKLCGENAGKGCSPCKAQDLLS